MKWRSPLITKAILGCFIQGEILAVFLLILLWGSMEKDTKNGFLAMNEAIKKRAEIVK